MGLALEAGFEGSASGAITPRAGDAAAALAAQAREALGAAVVSAMRSRRSHLASVLGDSLAEAFLVSGAVAGRAFESQAVMWYPWKPQVKVGGAPPWKLCAPRWKPTHVPTHRTQELLEEEEASASGMEQLLGGCDVGDDVWPPEKAWQAAAKQLAAGQAGASFHGGGSHSRAWASRGVGKASSNGSTTFAAASGGGDRGFRRNSSSWAPGGARASRHSAAANDVSAWARQPSQQGGAASQDGITASTAPAEAQLQPTAEHAPGPGACGGCAHRPARVAAAAHSLLAFAGGALQALRLYHPELHVGGWAATDVVVSTQAGRVNTLTNTHTRTRTQMAA
jgi:hypothetical protein